MRIHKWAALLVVIGVAGVAAAQVPSHSAGTEGRWTVEQPEELVAYVLFDPATVADRIPPALRPITVAELAEQGQPWAAEQLASCPSHSGWGVSFFEIVRMQVFEIDGRRPAWPEDGAAALWLARVAATNPAMDPGLGVPLLLLDFWLPDSLYAAYMREKGFYATHGDARLVRNAAGGWRGSLAVDGLSVVTDCMPSGPVAGGEQSRGTQILFPPLSSSLTTVVQVAFVGHRTQECDGQSSWSIEGTHPLAGGLVLGPSSYQFGYRLTGGVLRE